MKIVSRLIVGCVLTIPALYINVALAADGSITVIAPKDGVQLTSGSGIKLEYNVLPSPSGNHLHVYVDDQKPIIVRKVTGCPCSTELPDLTPGQHKIVIKEATSSHAMTGVESTVTVTVK